MKYRILASIVGIFCCMASAWADVKYTVTPLPSAKAVAVRMEITNPNSSEIVRIPAWCPGFYFLLDFDKSIFDLNVFNSNGEKQKFLRLDNRSIRLSSNSGDPIVVTYRVQGGDTGLGFFRTHVRSTSAFINGPSAFMYAESHMTEPHMVKFNLPTGWDVATAMDTDGSGVFKSAGYDEFVDHPIQFGQMVRRKFKVENTPFEAIWVGDPAPNCNVDQETERLKAGSLPAIKMFKDVPFSKYLYIIHLEVGDFAGGLEHRASTVMAVNNTRQIRLDSLATHEYFHAWNVKQIRPSILGPFDYTSPQRTNNLWFSEGVTDYYANVHAYQAGFYSISQYLSALTDEIETLELGKTRLKLTVEDASRQAWENGGFGVGDLSYYTKGLVIGFLFDAAIRGGTEGTKSFDDVLRLAYKNHKLPLPGFEEDGLRQMIMEVGGEKMDPLYTKMVRSVEPLPYNVLQNIGLRLIVPGKEYTEPRFILDEKNRISNATVSKLEGGIKDGDEVLLTRFVDSSTVEVLVKRLGEDMKFKVAARTYKAGDYRLQLDPFATLQAQKLRAAWLKR